MEVVTNNHAVNGTVKWGFSDEIEKLSAKAKKIVESEKLFPEPQEVEKFALKVSKEHEKDPAKRKVVIAQLLAVIRTNRLDDDVIRKLILSQTHKNLEDTETAQRLMMAVVYKNSGKSIISQSDFFSFCQQYFPELIGDFFAANPKWNPKELKDYYVENWVSEDIIDSFELLVGKL